MVACPVTLVGCQGPWKGTDIAWNKELGIEGDSQRSFWCGEKQFAFIFLNKPIGISRLGSTFCEQILLWKSPGLSGRGLCAGEVEVIGLGAAVRIGILVLSLLSYRTSIFSS